MLCPRSPVLFEAEVPPWAVRARGQLQTRGNCGRNGDGATGAGVLGLSGDAADARASHVNRALADVLAAQAAQFRRPQARGEQIKCEAADTMRVGLPDGQQARPFLARERVRVTNRDSTARDPGQDVSIEDTIDGARVPEDDAQLAAQVVADGRGRAAARELDGESGHVGAGEIGHQQAAERRSGHFRAAQHAPGRAVGPHGFGAGVFGTDSRPDKIHVLVQRHLRNCPHKGDVSAGVDAAQGAC